MKSVSFVGLCLVFLADSLPEAHAKHRQIVNGDHFRDVDVDNSRHITMQEVKIYMENKFEVRFIVRPCGASLLTSTHPR